jgi:hypothetical protein
MIDLDIPFPITLDWGDGEISQFDDLTHLITNLEHFDSETSPECRAQDASGLLVSIKLYLMELERLERIPSPAPL